MVVFCLRHIYLKLINLMGFSVFRAINRVPIARERATPRVSQDRRDSFKCNEARHENDGFFYFFNNWEKKT